MKKKKINIVCIIDKSGSMSSIATEAINGFNTFLLDQQKSDYKAKMTLLLFDSHFYKLYDNVNVNKIEPLNNKTYQPGTMTALLDSIGISIDEYLDRLASTPKNKRGEKTLFVILTDGFENASKTYHKNLIKLMINEMREEFNSEFIFLGASSDSFLQSDELGISKNNTYNYSASGEGIQIAYSKISEAVKCYVTTDKTDNLFEKIK